MRDHASVLFLTFGLIFHFGQVFAIASPNPIPYLGNQDDFDPGSIQRNYVDLKALEKADGTKTPEGFDPLAPSCAEKLILIAAKKNVADRFDNNPTGSGTCAYGVRTSLQLSTVGDITEGLGNAIDYLQNLPPKGFIDSGIRDLDLAPVGSVLVFAGPKSQSYLKDGSFGSPPGDWLGHITIVGDDDHYYTDGKTPHPALGWVGHRNVSQIRNLVGVYVPGPDLVEKFKDRCSASR